MDCSKLQLWLDLKLQSILSCSSNHSDLKEKERNTSSSIYLSIDLITQLFINPSFIHPFTLSMHTSIHTYIHASKQVFIQLTIYQSCILHTYIHTYIPLSIHPFNQLSNQLFIQPIIYQACIIHPLSIHPSI